MHKNRAKKSLKTFLACALIGLTVLITRPAHADLISSQNYNNQAFAPNGGPSFSSSILPNVGNYSIVTDFSFTDLNGYRKIVDFKDLGSDNGFYNLNSSPVFYNGGLAASGTATFQSNQLSRVVITRDANSNLFSTYVDGTLQFTYTDTGSAAVFTGSNIHFFQDDGSGNEASAGNYDYIAFYDNALTASDVVALGPVGTYAPGTITATPEPSTYAMMALGLSVMGLLGRKRRKSEAAQ
jgi:hypothetical protein